MSPRRLFISISGFCGVRAIGGISFSSSMALMSSSHSAMMPLPLDALESGIENMARLRISSFIILP
jgi:hypothetical protein